MQKATIFVLLAVIAVASAETVKNKKPPQETVGSPPPSETDPTKDEPKSILQRISSLRDGGLRDGGVINNVKLKSLKKDSAPQDHPSVGKSSSFVRRMASEYESRTDSTVAQRPVSSPKFGRKSKI